MSDPLAHSLHVLDMVEAVQSHARDRCRSGWNAILEDFDTEEIADTVGHCASAEQAIEVVADFLGLTVEKPFSAEDTIF